MAVTRMLGERLDWLANLSDLNVELGKESTQILHIYHDQFGRRVQAKHTVKLGEEGSKEYEERLKRAQAHPLEGTVRDYLSALHTHAMLDELLDRFPELKGNPELQQRAVRALSMAFDSIPPKTPVYQKKEVLRGIGGNYKDPKFAAERAEEKARQFQRRWKEFDRIQERRALDEAEADELAKIRQWLSSGELEKKRVKAQKYAAAAKKYSLYEPGVAAGLKEEMQQKIAGFQVELAELRKAVGQKQKAGKQATKKEEEKERALVRKIAGIRGERRLVGLKVKPVLGAIQLIRGYPVVRVKGPERTQYTVELRGNVTAADSKLRPAVELLASRIKEMEKTMIPRLQKRSEENAKWVATLGTLRKLSGKLRATAAAMPSEISGKHAQDALNTLQREIIDEHLSGSYGPNEHWTTRKARAKIEEAIKALRGETPRPLDARKSLNSAAYHLEIAHNILLNPAGLTQKVKGQLKYERLRQR